MDQKAEENDSSVGAQKPIDYLEQIEVKISQLGKFVPNMLTQLTSKSESESTDMRNEFNNAVEPLLLQHFHGNWIGFLLWDDRSQTLHVLHKYARDFDIVTDKRRYDFVSDFINSKAFKEHQFAEPMGDIIFSDKSNQKKVLIFIWKDNHKDVIKEIKNLHDDIKPIVICFEDLGETEWMEEVEKRHQFVEQIIEQMHQSSISDHNAKENYYAKLATEISSLAKKITDYEGENEEKVFSKASKKIECVFERSIHPEDLCRALIWNRLFDQTWQYLYYIPAKFLEGTAVSGIVCAFPLPLKREEYMMLTGSVNRIFSLFHFGIHLEQIQSYVQQLHLFALRSAAAAIMARNKSHIHGSHIEHGLRNKMDSFENIVSERLSKRDDFYQNLRKMLTF